MPPNKSPEPTAVGAVSSAVAVHAAGLAVAQLFSLGVIMRRPFFQSARSLWLFLPIVAVPLFLPSGESRSWYDIGKGWPWHYGWQPDRYSSDTVSEYREHGSICRGLACGFSYRCEFVDAREIFLW